MIVKKVYKAYNFNYKIKAVPDGTERNGYKMNLRKRAIPLLMSLSMLITVMPQHMVSAQTEEYQTAYSDIAADDYAVYNEDFYTNGINFKSSGNDGFVYKKGAWVGYNVDFGEDYANTLVMNMRPDVRNFSGKFGVYADSMDSEPIVVFDESANMPYSGYKTYAGAQYSDYCFNLAQPLTGKHTVYFNGMEDKEASSASFLEKFSFLKDTVVNPYERQGITADLKTWGSCQTVKEEPVGSETIPVLPINSGAVYFTGLDFGNDAEQGGVGASVILGRWGSADNDSIYEIRLDSIDGPVIGSLEKSDVKNGYAAYDVKFNTMLRGVHTVAVVIPASTAVGGIEFIKGTEDDLQKPPVATDENTTYQFTYDNVSSSDGGLYQNQTNVFTKTDGKHYSAVFKNVDFGDTKSTYALNFKARTLSKADDSNVLKFYIDSTETEPIGEFWAKDGINTSTVCSYPVNIPNGISGLHDVYAEWTGQWIVSEFTCIKGITDVFGDENNGIISAASSLIRSSTDSAIQNNGNLDNGHTVSNIGKGGLVNSVSFAGLDFGDDGAEKLTLRMTRVDTTANGTVNVLLGDRRGKVIASKPLSEIASGGTFKSYDFALSENITGIQMITVTIDYESILNYIGFDLSDEPVIIDPDTVKNGHEAVSVLDCVSMQGGSYASSTAGSNSSVYAPVYTTGMSEGGTLTFNLKLQNAKYAAICAKSANTQTAPIVSLKKGNSQIASFTVPQAGRNGAGYYLDVYTAELAKTISGTAEYTLIMEASAANIAWIRFMTEEEYSAFTSRTKVSLLGDSNVEYGKYTVPLREMLDVNEYDVKSLGNSGKTVRNYKQQTQYAEALAYAPDIAVFTLGTNDSAQSCDDAYMAAFENDYAELIEGLKNVNPNVKVYLQYPLPFSSDAPDDYSSYSNDKLVNKIIPAIKAVAEKEDAEIIDIYHGVLNYGYDRELLYNDGLHVNEAGGTIMAKLTKSAITSEKITPADGDASAITVVSDTNVMTEKGETAKVSADKNVYWRAESLDGTPTDKAEVTKDGIVTAVKPGVYKITAISKSNTSVKESVQMENRFEYVISEDADLINSKSYSLRALKTFRKPFVSGYADGTVIMLKDVMLDDVSAFTVRASSMYDTSVLPLKVECHLDSVGGEIIGSTIITKNTKDSKYAFSPYKNAIVPVCDGKAHNLFFVLNRGKDINNTVRTIDGIYGIGFEYGSAKNIAVFEDGVLQDTMPMVNSSFDTTEKFDGYKAGHTYTWKTTTAGTNGDLIIAVHDENGMLKQLAAADKNNGVYSAELTLPQEFNSSYTIKSIALDSISTLKPLLQNPNMQNPDKIKIGCVGDSITNNWNSDELGYQDYCYPKYLQSMIGTDKYEVMNFGRGTSTASSYKDNPWFERAKEAKCDVYIIMLGTNDSKSSTYYNAIVTDYQTIIDGLKAANPNCKIYINLPIPAHGENYGISDSVIVNEVIPRVKAVAEKNGITPLDLHTELQNNSNYDAMYFSDNIHPNEFGQSFIAECIKNAYFKD